MREYLETHGITDNRSIDALVRELHTYCLKFQQVVVSEFSGKEHPIKVPMYTDDGECLMPNKNKLKNSFWEEEGCDVIDLRFSKF